MDDETIPFNNFNFRSIQDIHAMAVGDSIDLLGVIKRSDAPQSIKLNKTVK
jgi:hypothetical protein